MTTTTHRSIRPGPAGGGGWRELEPGPGLEREGALADGADPLATLWHLSDIHLCDAESPARQEYLDRYGDPDSEWRAELGLIGTYRPQEILTVQVAVSMVETINAITHGPLLGAPVDSDAVGDAAAPRERVPDGDDDAPVESEAVADTAAREREPVAEPVAPPRVPVAEPVAPPRVPVADTDATTAVADDGMARREGRAPTTYSEALLDPCHSYFGATSSCASTCFRSPLCHQ